MQEQFDWGRLGDISAGRENLGENMPVIVYRLLQFTMKDVLTDKFGAKVADDIFREAGYLAGLSFAENVLKKSDDFSVFYENLQEELKALKIGVLRFEKADVDKMEFVITVSEDLDCSGLPVTDETICSYDEGFISGLLEHHTGKGFAVEEIDCWATGARTCRFNAKAK